MFLWSEENLDSIPTKQTSQCNFHILYPAPGSTADLTVVIAQDNAHSDQTRACLLHCALLWSVQTASHSPWSNTFYEFQISSLAVYFPFWSRWHCHTWQRISNHHPKSVFLVGLKFHWIEIMTVKDRLLLQSRWAMSVTKCVATALWALNQVLEGEGVAETLKGDQGWTRIG